MKRAGKGKYFLFIILILFLTSCTKNQNTNESGEIHALVIEKEEKILIGFIPFQTYEFTLKTDDGRIFSYLNECRPCAENFELISIGDKVIIEIYGNKVLSLRSEKNE